jgi:hypothetical protein
MKLTKLNIEINEIGRNLPLPNTIKNNIHNFVNPFNLVI